jgi:lysozyme family protein
MNFDEAFERVIGHEGGYVNDPRDPGGQTHYGISKRSYPAEDIPGMTLERAKTLYRRDFWGPAGCDAVPEGIRYALFDTAVNSGVKPAIKMLQRAVSEVDDGLIGPRTLTAAGSMPSPRLVARMCAQRLKLLTDLPNFDTYGRGWTRRVLSILQEA